MRTQGEKTVNKIPGMVVKEIARAMSRNKNDLKEFFDVFLGVQDSCCR